MSPVVSKQHNSCYPALGLENVNVARVYLKSSNPLEYGIRKNSTAYGVNFHAKSTQTIGQNSTGCTVIGERGMS